MRLNHCYNLIATHNIVKVILRCNFPVRFFAFQLTGKERREISFFAFSAKVLKRVGILFWLAICYMCGFFFHTCNKFDLDWFPLFCVAIFTLLLFKLLLDSNFLHNEFQIICAQTFYNLRFVIFFKVLITHALRN